jgi:hypothetical protein
MNKFKKVALTALGASLAATSANAVDVSVSGSSEIGYATGSGNYDATAASAFGAGTGVSFSASGELDNGWTVSTTHATSNAFALTSSNIKVDTGSFGAFRFNRIGAAASNGNDDVLPTAWEEANDKAAHSVRGTKVADGLTSGSLSLILPTFEFAGGSIDLTLDYDPAATSGGGDPGAQIARTAGVGSGTAVGAKLAYGPVTLYAAHATEESTVASAGNDGKNAMVQIVADLGALSVGAGEWYANEENGATDYSTSGMSIAFNVNDDLSFSYGELEDTKEGDSATAAVTTDIKSLQVAYSMGSMSVKAKRVETDNPYQQTTQNSDETMEISVSFSF